MQGEQYLQRPCGWKVCRILKKASDSVTQGAGKQCSDISASQLFPAYKTPGDFLLNAGSGLVGLKWSLKAEAVLERPGK